MKRKRHSTRALSLTLVMALLFSLFVNFSVYAEDVEAQDKVTDSAKVSIQKAAEAPNIETLNDVEKTLTVQSGTTVGQLISQIEPSIVGSTYSFKVVDWLGEEKIAWENRPDQDDLLTKRLDMLTTSDKLVVSAGTDETAEYEILVPGEAPYWNTDRYNSILDSVKSNLPVFPDNIFDITSSEYAGLVRQVTEGDTIVDDYTLVFRKAIADVTKAGGGTVLVPKRTEPYRTGAIQLDNNVNLHIEKGATIDFLNIVTGEYYPRSLTTFEGIDYYGFSPAIYAHNKENIAITGGGKIEFTNTSQWSGDVDNTIRNWNYANTPVEKRDAFSLNQKITVSLVQFYSSKNILIEGVTFGNSPFWSINPVQSENILLRGVTITSISSNSDGFNPESSRNVIIENNVFANKDDNIALKSGRTNNGKLREKPTENIIIRSNIFWQGSGISVGSEAAGGINNIFIENNFHNGVHENDSTNPMGNLSRNVFRIKTANSLDAVFEDIFFRNIAVGGMREYLFHIERVADQDMWFQTAEISNYGTKKNVAQIRNIAMSNVFSVANRATGNVDSTFSGFIETEISDLRAIDSLYFKDIDITSSRLTNGKNLTVNNVTNLEMDNVRINDTLYNTEHSISIEDVEVNGVALNELSTTEVTSHGDNGTVEVTGRVVTDIANYENIGSVRVSYDIDKNFAIAELSKVGDEVRFKATLTNVGAGIHDLAVVAKNNKLPHYVVDNNLDNRKSADMVYHDVKTFEIDVEGTLRTMDVRFEYAPSLTPYHNVPVFMYGESAKIIAVITDAKTGEPVEGATINVNNQSNFGVEVDGNTIMLSGIRDNAIVRNHIVINITHPGYVSKEHHFRRVVSVPDSSRLKTIMPSYSSLITYKVVGNGNMLATADGTSINSGTNVNVGQFVEFTATPDLGFKVKGWSLNGVSVNDTNDTYTFTSLSNADVMVEFEREEGTSIVSFDGNGGTGNMDSAKIISNKYAVPESSFIAPIGMKFVGWRVNNKGEVLVPGTNINVDGDFTLYAVWDYIIKVDNVSNGNMQANINFDIRSANGQGYTVYISDSGEKDTFKIADFNFNSKGAHVRNLANGKTYFAYIEYNNDGVFELSKIVTLEQHK
ncbi:glycosyl hydrolase family 28 protein [Fredinandcohnia onubensis]|uniref:glycosyl hydrolase family 28 protein n=1 Tax=Fredinandcohnia onubensis TaxID=1571209 RepID=UPI000C0BF53F|nr:glycosyl hydrolase family 28 protein [Fredinandcohnia onubensis]